MSSVVRGSTTTRGMSRYGLASEAYRTRSIALWRTFAFPRRAMRSAFRSPGVPSTREVETASHVGGPSNRPIRAGVAENSFLVNAASPLSLVLYGVAQDTDPFDLHFEDIARLHENRWLAHRPNATGCSGDNHITRFQTHRDADHCDQLGDAEDELVGTRILHHSAVQAALNAQPVGPRRHGIGRHQPGAERPGGIEILAHRPLRRAQLKIANRRIVEQGVARNVIEGSVALDAASSPADHHGELRLIVEGGRFAWPQDRFTVSDQTRREAREDFGIDRLLESAFLEVIIVVETDTEDFRRPGHRRQYPNCVQVDSMHGQKVSASAQQICTLCNQFGQSAWEAAFALHKAMPARAVIRCNSGDTPLLEMNNAHRFPLVARGHVPQAPSIRSRVSCRGESRQKPQLQLAFISFGADLQYFPHARLRHLARDTQIGLMGFHQKPLCHGTKCSSIHGRLGVSDGMRGK